MLNFRKAGSVNTEGFPLQPQFNISLRHPSGQYWRAVRNQYILQVVNVQHILQAVDVRFGAGVAACVSLPPHQPHLASFASWKQQQA
jgi:hypothetical protein